MIRPVTGVRPLTLSSEEEARARVDAHLRERISNRAHLSALQDQSWRQVLENASKVISGEADSAAAPLDMDTDSPAPTGTGN